jgi:hypothetical protein
LIGYKLDRLFFATDLVIEGIGMPFSNFSSLSIESYVSLSVQDFPNASYKYNAQCSCCENYIVKIYPYWFVKENVDVFLKASGPFVVS